MGHNTRLGRGSRLEHPRLSHSLRKTKLNATDKGRCLITFEKSLTNIEPCHIVSRKIASDKIKYFQQVWGLAEFDIDSPQNLVSLRADWRTAYSQGSWVFVPVQSILDKIQAYASTASFEKPYSAFRKNTEYVFLALPGLDITTIQRARFHRRASETYQSSDNFSGLPTFKHHAHPFLVILNALPKLKAHADSLAPSQRLLLQAMERIHDRWAVTPPGTGNKRRRDDTEDTPQDETGHKDKRKNQAPNEKVLRPARTNIETGGPCKEPTQNNTMVTWQPSQPPPVLPNGTLLNYAERARILAWANGVAAAQLGTTGTAH